MFACGYIKVENSTKDLQCINYLLCVWPYIYNKSIIYNMVKQVVERYVHI